MTAINTFKTHIGETRKMLNSQLLEVCDLLEWSPEQYCWYQFEQYENFARRICLPDNRTAYDIIRYSPVFRGFWNAEWADRNTERFLPFAYDCKYDRWAIHEEFLLVHNYELLIHDDSFYNRFESIIKLIKP